MRRPVGTPKTRSAVTNGTREFLEPVLDTPHMRRYRDLLRIAETERGGREAMTVTAHEAARAWAMLAVMLERMHVAAARGEKVNLEDLGQIGDRMDRQARRMGPVKANRAPTLKEHATARRAERSRA